MKLCQDCKLPKSECICELTCDFCQNVESLCTCGLDTDPYGNKIFDHAEWLRDLEDQTNAASLDEFEGKYTTGGK